MKILVFKILFVLALGNPEMLNSTDMHTIDSGELNNITLDQIETLIRKKAGAEFNRKSENSFVLNGYKVYTEVAENRYSPSVYEEFFQDEKNPENIYRMRLVKNLNGDRELAVLIHGEEGSVNYHATFDFEGNMLDEDPWGNDEGYTIEIFKVYDKYRKIYSQKVNAVK